MSKIRDQKLLYHLTHLDNLSSILEHGLLPRAQIDDFEDVADQEIIQGRQDLNLQDYVPFHWFARNPFDGRVQADRPGEPFVLISVRRTVAQRNNWPVIPCHPLANGDIELLNYDEGVGEIDWDLMDERDYHDHECKSVCMAECLSPDVVSPDQFFKIYTPTNQIARGVELMIRRQRVQVDVAVNAGMFIR